ncbi:MAG: 1-deoxy-D-xylulose-5-phosphate synthase, partial [Actinomycetota bacterium]|nr:1-deoxy-D-xylulose-5-phosphate synthase [Actinomycetota bacterium]
ERVAGIDVLRRAERPEVLLVAVGATAALALDVAERVRGEGLEVTVVDPRWVLPINPALRDLAAGHRLVVTVEDSGGHGGVGSALSQDLREHELDVPVRNIALPQRFLVHGSRAELLAAHGLTGQDVARRLLGWASRIIEGADTPATDRV